jgi:hypothetical protein
MTDAQIAGCVLLLLAYCLPIIIALARTHPQRGAIALLTMLGGWTAVCWVIALVWAVMRYDGGYDPYQMPGHDARQ